MCVTISLLCFHLLTLFFMNSVPTPFMLSTHYIELFFFWFIYQNVPPVLYSLFAALFLNFAQTRGELAPRATWSHRVRGSGT